MILTHVERLLQRQCQPGAHSFVTEPSEPRRERCALCQRRQAVDGTTCLMCDQAGEGRFWLANVQFGRVVEGCLCAQCHREFAFRSEIRGWAITRYVPAPPEFTASGSVADSASG